ncbi:membrane integrity-associated transporter subunit PqiC [Photobacterium sp. OFAV2-7]|uniref:PqiC family protein n=1 Tax=Photobacterium sp. OFAV2-7 TaxID=2917748 RepID=UPI001EF4E041|nr:ABC-type transport auxiliary lipoprotein family protein [Photobacterium sp. OFAV2-7]MCG7587074.1 ABC-type transport auxiliary lipoprotein family protein [Photobacterium sp. OFAV2-7]
MRKWLMILGGILVGCSSQPTEPVSNTYLLPSGNQAVTSAIATNQPLLVVRPVEMAEHLSGNGLVYQLSDTEVVQAQQNLWAESISEQLTRRINNDLRQKQSRYWPTELTPALSTMGVPRLQVKVNQFNGHYTGVAKVSGEWLLLDAKGVLQGVYPFTYQVPLERDGYDAQVKALSEAVNRLTTQMAQRIAIFTTKT